MEGRLRLLYVVLGFVLVAAERAVAVIKPVVKEYIDDE